MRTGTVRFNMDSGKQVEVGATAQSVFVAVYSTQGIQVYSRTFTREEACAFAEAFEFLGVRPSYIERAYERCGEPKAGE